MGYGTKFIVIFLIFLYLTFIFYSLPLINKSLVTRSASSPTYSFLLLLLFFFLNCEASDMFAPISIENGHCFDNEYLESCLQLIVICACINFLYDRLFGVRRTRQGQRRKVMILSLGCIELRLKRWRANDNTKATRCAIRSRTIYGANEWLIEKYAQSNDECLIEKLAQRIIHK